MPMEMQLEPASPVRKFAWRTSYLRVKRLGYAGPQTKRFAKPAGTDLAINYHFGQWGRDGLYGWTSWQCSSGRI